MTRPGINVPQWAMVDEGWGRKAVEFATLSGPGNCREYVAVQHRPGVAAADRLLDVACGSGLAVELARLPALHLARIYFRVWVLVSRRGEEVSPGRVEPLLPSMQDSDQAGILLLPFLLRPILALPLPALAFELPSPTLRKALPAENGSTTQCGTSHPHPYRRVHSAQSFRSSRQSGYTKGLQSP
jgi:hypothetical protein